MRFLKYHALGNDYIVIDPTEVGGDPGISVIQRICHRNFGVGSDGILWGPLASDRADFRLRIFNPDGSEAEKSGNGLRIFSRYLWDRGRVKDQTFTVDTLGGVVESRVMEKGRLVQVAMGKVSFWSDAIPVRGPRREVLRETIQAGDRRFEFCAATIGNPHCVLPLPEISKELACRYGPLLETHGEFPNRTNVQFLQIMDCRNIRIEIWERGAGYTLASGSSASAAAAVAYRLGFVEADVTVHMPGGALAIAIRPDNSILMTGPVTAICEGELRPEMFGD